MKQGTKKKLAVITMSTVMAACVAGGVGYAKTNHAVLASADTATATVTVVPENLLVFDVESEVTIEAGMHSSTYYIDLAAGEYSIELTLSDGTSIQVTINGETVVAYGEIEGNFTISAEQAGYVQIIFTTESNEAVTFTVR